MPTDQPKAARLGLICFALRGPLTRSASFDVALPVVLAPKGPDKTAQGNARWTRNTAKNKGKSPERAQQPTGDVSPLQGSVEHFANATPGVAPGCFVVAPSGRMKYGATSKSASEGRPPRLARPPGSVAGVSGVSA
jgi:hypothetical protein